MKSDFRVDFIPQNSEQVLLFSGTLDERAIFPDLPLTNNLIFDLDKITRMSSSGAEYWLRWVRKHSLMDLRIEVRNLPTCFIRVLNVIPDLVPVTWKIQSFHVPYVGIESSVAENILFIRDKHFTNKDLTIPPLVSSQINGGKLEIDVSPGKYFRFLLARFPDFKISGSL